LEEGKAKYGVGTERQMCLLIDRAGVVWRDGEKKKEKLDFSVVPNLVELFRHIFTQTLVRGGAGYDIAVCCMTV
jgi:hypothetical protein